MILTQEQAPSKKETQDSVSLEGIMIAEISQTEEKTNAACYHLHVESKEYNKLVNTSKKKGTMERMSQ